MLAKINQVHDTLIMLKISVENCRQSFDISEFKNFIDENNLLLLIKAISWIQLNV